MSNIRAIKDQIKINLQAVTKFVQIQEDPDFVEPTFESCPAAIIQYDNPWMLAKPLANSLYQYRWQFAIDILVSPIGIGKIEDWFKVAEPLPTLLIAQFAAHAQLKNANNIATATSIVFDTDFPKPAPFKPPYSDTLFFGFTWRLGVWEANETTFAA